MMQLSVRDSGTLGILTLRGKFSRFHAIELQTHLTRGINRANRLIVNCEQVTSLDMTCLRLLCTAYRVSYVLNKGFVLAGDRAALFRLAAGESESTRCSGAGLGCDSACLWSDGGPAGGPREQITESMYEQDSAAA